MGDTNTERALGRIEGKVDEIRADNERHHEWMKAHEKRIGKVEKKVHTTWIIGSIALAAVAVKKTIAEWIGI